MTTDFGWRTEVTRGRRVLGQTAAWHINKAVRRIVRVAHLTTVDLSLSKLLAPQLEAVRESGGEAIGISAPGPYVETLEAAGIRHVPLTSSTRRRSIVADVRAAAELFAVLRREKPDVLHTHNPKPGLYGRVIGRLAGVPIVVNTVHGLYATPDHSVPFRAVVYALEAVASRFGHAELYQNPEDVDLARRLRIVPPSKLELLGNGIDLERFHPERHSNDDRRSIRDEHGIESDEVVVGIVARLVADKGYQELLAASEQLGGRYPVLAIGPIDDEKADSLPSSFHERAAAARMFFVGEQHDIERWFSAIDVFVLPSHREGFPRAAMEAAAAGLPVIATDIRGCRQVVDHERTGVLVPLGDIDALAKAIDRLGSDGEVRGRFGKAAREKAAAEFDQRNVVDTVLQTYQRVADERGITTRVNDWTSLHRLRRKPAQRAIMRTFDVVASTVALVLLAPVLAAIAVAVGMSSGWPVFFRQERAGRGGAPFSIYKFRTMRDATDERGEDLPDAHRVTRIGTLLRRTSLDELPQLLNVIRGEMSLVGPRPLYVDYVAHYTESHRRRLSVPPGITGWAAVHGRDAVAWKDRLDLEAWYAEHWSLLLNLKILVRTLRQITDSGGFEPVAHEQRPDFVALAGDRTTPAA